MEYYGHVKRKFKKLMSAIYRTIATFIERLYGIDFSRFEYKDGILIYECSKFFEIRHIFRKMKLPSNSKAIDFGSGKGLVVWYLSKLLTSGRVRGIESCNRLADISRHNLSKLGTKNAEILNIDATNVHDDIIDDSSLFYFYNPFNKRIFEYILVKIEESIDRNPREVLIIYFNPVYNNVILGSKYVLGFEKHNNFFSNAPTMVYRLNKCIQ